MHFIFNRYKKTRESNRTISNQHSISAYSNLGYISTPDLTIEIPSVYSIQAENDVNLIRKIFLFC